MKGASQIAPLGIRLPEDLKDKIKGRAKENGRSVNSEIVQILEDSLNSDAQNKNLEFDRLVEQYEKYIKMLEQVVSVQDQSIELASEQIALLKQHIKNATGVDVQEYLNKMVDYDGIKKAVHDKHFKKPT